METFPKRGSLVLVGVHNEGRFVGTLVDRSDGFVMLANVRQMNGRRDHRVVDGGAHVREVDLLKNFNSTGVPSWIAYRASWFTKCVVDEKE
jgi:hypothetical protein